MNTLIITGIVLIEVFTIVITFLIYNKVRNISDKLNRYHKDVLGNVASYHSNSLVVDSDGEEQLNPFLPVKYLVVAESYTEAQNWRTENGVSTNNCIYVSSEEVIREELPNTPVIFYKHWGRRKDANDIWLTAQQCQMKVLEES